MIKVKYTKMHEIISGGYKTATELQASFKKNVLVIDAELVFIESQYNARFCIKPNGTKHLNPLIGIGYKPILISETEKIEVDDVAYNCGVKRYGKVVSIKNGNITIDNDQYIDTSSINNFTKVLALPKHFSPKQLQDIVDGKLKEGKCLLECESKRMGGVYDTQTYRQDFIKRKPYITIYPFEEKMYTREEVRKIVKMSHESFKIPGSKIITIIDKWFEQNVK